MIKRGKEAQKRNELRASLRSGTTVRTYLEVPRVPVTSDDDPVRGSKTAPVQIVMWSDFQCPFCSACRDDAEADRGQVRGQGRDHLPRLSAPVPPERGEGGRGGELRPRPGQVLGVPRCALLESVAAGHGRPSRRPAETIGLDMTAFNKCVESGEMKAEIEKDTAAGQAFGVNGTPASFVNGRLLGGAQPFENFCAASSTMSCRSREFRFRSSGRVRDRHEVDRSVRKPGSPGPDGHGTHHSTRHEGRARKRPALVMLGAPAEPSGDRGERAALGGLTPPGVDQRRSDADVVPAGRSSGSAAGFRDAVIRRRESLHGRLATAGGGREGGVRRIRDWNAPASGSIAVPVSRERPRRVRGDQMYGPALAPPREIRWSTTARHMLVPPARVASVDRSVAGQDRREMIRDRRSGHRRGRARPAGLPTSRRCRSGTGRRVDGGASCGRILGTGSTPHSRRSTRKRPSVVRKTADAPRSSISSEPGRACLGTRASHILREDDGGQGSRVDGGRSRDSRPPCPLGGRGLRAPSERGEPERGRRGEMLSRSFHRSIKQRWRERRKFCRAVTMRQSIPESTQEDHARPSRRASRFPRAGQARLGSTWRISW